MTIPRDQLAIDKRIRPDGSYYYILGNQYWVADYKEFYRWWGSVNAYRYCNEDVDDFPHHWWTFRNDPEAKAIETQMCVRWAKAIQEVPEDDDSE